ncbi:DUF2058 domain-containing protein [Vibrio profundum]|uniref:DUF2058 domain-containing protein n=1 Tax=Vibrio profundum TaxID=2910247 RepID=UPI003D0CEB93
MAKLTLQEQMLKAGLVNEKKLKKAKKGSKKSRVQARETREAVETQKAAQLERDQQLNQQLKEQQLTKEVRSQIKQLIDMNKLELKDGDVKYNFTDGKFIKSIHVEPLIHSQLVKGILAIARSGESYVVIPNSVAKKIALRDQEVIIENNTATEEIPAEDDPYADFVVPDDLMW